MAIDFGYKTWEDFPLEKDSLTRKIPIKKITVNEVTWYPKNVKVESLTFYQCPDHYGTACLIVDWDNLKAYFRSDCIS